MARKKTTASEQAGGNGGTMAEQASVAEEQRANMIREAAYFIAQDRGFAPGDEMRDWLQAEAEINARLSH